MGNKAANGPFTPLVIVVRNFMGQKDFNQLRGKAISLHSQGIYLHLKNGKTCSMGTLFATHIAAEALP